MQIPLSTALTTATSAVSESPDRELRIGTAQTPFGTCLLAWLPSGVCALHFIDPIVGSVTPLARSAPTVEQVQAQLHKQYPLARQQQDQAGAQALCARVFSPHGADAQITLALKGSPFQLKVWEALRQIPFGSVQSYGELATRLGHPKAARAVGTAVAANTIGYLIPCHRVVRQDGERGQFRWGAQRKATILDWESRQLAVHHASR